MHSFEVEEVEQFGSNFEGVVVGEILEISKHPNADKLQLTKVNVGNKVLEIVCGAHNISVGDKVPVATVGTKLPGGLEIKEAEIRGEKSFGMLCALDELGLGSDHSGILILEKDLKVGTPLAEVIGGLDEILEIKILPDRAHDALSHVGMAREIATLEGKKIDYDFDGLVLPRKKTKNLSVEIVKKAICPRYIGAIVNDVVVAESPSWLKSRLEACGIRPINNVVDATNYVMLEIGQPLHAFDYAQISKEDKVEIVVRNSKKGEKIVLLDESEKELDAEDIVIANQKEILALAGVMGGLNSGISEKTTRLVLEAATFDATSIRKTRTRLNLVTDSAIRFEKGLDPNLAEKAMVRVLEILEHIAGGRVEGFVDQYLEKNKPWNVKLDLAYVDNLLGIKVPFAAVKSILSSLNIKLKGNSKVLVAEIPTYRLDLKTQEDLIEEIGRIYGYEKIVPVAPKVALKGLAVNKQRFSERAVKDILVGQGFSELYNYSFYSSRDAQISPAAHLELEMPLSPEYAYLRTSLLPNIFKNIRENLKNFKQFQFFELGKIYLSGGQALPEEKTMLVGAMVTEKKISKEERQDRRNESDFFELKSQVDEFLRKLGVRNYQYVALDLKKTEGASNLWHAGRSAEIQMKEDGKTLGIVGEINPLVLADFDVHTRTVMFEFDMARLRACATSEIKLAPIGKYPTVVRDISMTVKEGILVDDLIKLIKDNGGSLVREVELFDIFAFEDGRTNFAFHVIIGNEERTLEGGEIDALMKKITENLEKNPEIEIRK